MAWWRSAEAGAPEGLTPREQLQKLEDLVAHPHYETDVNAEMLFRLGDLRCGIGDYTGAAVVLARLVETYPQYVHADRALITLAVALERAGDVESAVARYRAVLSSFPTSYLVDEADGALRRLGEVPAIPVVH